MGALAIARSVAMASLGLAGCDRLFTIHGGADGPAGDDGGGDAVAGDAGLVDAAPTTDAPSFTCANGYTVTGGSRYRIVVADVVWAVAEHVCDGDTIPGSGHGHLAVIGDAQEMANIAPLLGPPTWLGLTDRVTEGSFLWVTLEDTMGFPVTGASPPWAPGQPDNVGGQNCVKWSSTGIDDDSCNSEYQFLCECDGDPADLTRF